MNINAKTIIFLAIIFAFSYCSTTQKKSNNTNKLDDFIVMSYNVENLFDTINNPSKADDEFTPGSEKHWNTERYNKKIKDLSKVIRAIDKVNLPDIIALIEVENRNVIQDLADDKYLKKADYGIVHEESPDARGIDLALMYKKARFKYLDHKKIAVNFDFEPETKTRDILYVKGKMSNNEILHIFVNHWSSRREGMEKTEPKRLHAAKLLKNEVDNILAKDKNAKIIIVGDFNDEPQNKSLKTVLDAGNSKINNDKRLYNLLYSRYLSGEGTYNYRGNWNMLDNIIVSSALLNGNKGYVVESDSANILSEKWMLYYNKKYDYSTPSRTYGGPNYYGGISDHLPVYIKLIIASNRK